MDRHTQALGRGGQTEQVFQGVQVQPIGVAPAAVVTLAADAPAQRVALQPLQAGAAVALGEVAPIGLQGHGAFGRARDEQGAVLRISLDGVTLQALAHQLHGVGGERPDAARGVEPELRLDGRHLAGQPGQHLPAVTPRSHAAHALRFEQGDLKAALGQLQRGAHAREAAAHHAHLRALQAAQRGAWRSAGHRSLVVRSRAAQALQHAHGGVAPKPRLKAARRGWRHAGRPPS